MYGARQKGEGTEEERFLTAFGMTAGLEDCWVEGLGCCRDPSGSGLQLRGPSVPSPQDKRDDKAARWAVVASTLTALERGWRLGGWVRSRLVRGADNGGPRGSRCSR